MSKTNTEDVEQALAEERANQEKIGATVQAARASATRPQPQQGELPATTRGPRWQALEEHRNDLLRTNRRYLDEIVKLQAQRDELLVALQLAEVYVVTLNGEYFTRETQVRDAKAVRAAIARATEGAKANES